MSREVRSTRRGGTPAWGLAVALVLVCVLLASVLAGCPDPRACESTDDCFRGETCTDGLCSNQFEFNTNNNTNNGQQSETTLCPADRFDDGNRCVDQFDQEDPNDEWLDASKFAGTTRYGCTNDEEFTPLDTTIQASLCVNEPADFYEFSYTQCETKSFLIELTFRPAEPCDPSVVGFDSQHLACAEDYVRCTTLSNGGRRIQAVIEPSSSPSLGGTPRFRVFTPREGEVRVNYEVDVKVFR